jgi:hypothetical protein
MWVVHQGPSRFFDWRALTVWVRGRQAAALLALVLGLAVACVVVVAVVVVVLVRRVCGALPQDLGYTGQEHAVFDACRFGEGGQG